MEVSIPQPLTSEEIIEGIAVRMCAELPALGADRDELKSAIMASLAKTCSLNRAVYSKFSAKWKAKYATLRGRFFASWWVDYSLDDFGRITGGGIGGSIRNPDDIGLEFDGEIPEMPPDKFRRDTQQAIPQSQTVKPKEQNQVGLTHSPKTAVRGKDA